MQRTPRIAAALAGAAGLALTLGVVVPAIADDAADDAGTSESRTFGDRLTRLKEALAGLVSDGTLTQAQADKVAETLDQSDVFRGPGGHGGMGGGPGGPAGMRGGMDLSVAAETLGLETDALLDLLRDGSTLADVAEQQGVEVSTLVDTLVAAATERIDEAVADGALEQDRADDLKADLESRISAMVEQGMPRRGDH